MEPAVELDYNIVNETGMHRTNNEDAVLFVAPKKPWIKQAMGSLAIVADGMGGHAKGEKASKLAVDIISDEYYKKIAPPEKALEQACLKANNTIIDEGTKIDQNIGTTCTAVAITAKTLHILHIGDSRAYLLQKRKLHQLTTDHTLANQQPYSENEFDTNILTRSLGTEFSKECQAQIFKLDVTLGKDDRIILCTDGLHNYISFEEMENTLNTFSLEELCKQWVKWVLQRGAQDNFSFIVIQLKIAD